MKKIISIVLAVMLVVSVAVVSVGAYNTTGDYSAMCSGDGYTPTDSYTVDAKTPYCEDAILDAGGSLDEVMNIYVKAPADWANEYNTFPGPDLPDNEPYMHVCIYWWDGTGADWSNGNHVAWCGYQTHLVDKENLIYKAIVPNDGLTATIVWNNGVNAGMDESAPFFKFGHQFIDCGVEGIPAGNTYLPEGSDDEWTNDGLISIEDKTVVKENDLTHIPSYGSNWFAYYGKGCYGNYTMTSENYHGRTANCINPEHDHAKAGDANLDKVIDVNDVEAIQRYLAHLDEFSDAQKEAADADGDEYVSIIDATRIQRYLAKICNIDGSKPYVEE